MVFEIQKVKDEIFQPNNMEEKLFFDVFNTVIYGKKYVPKLNINLFLSDSCIQTCSGTKNYAFLNK